MSRRTVVLIVALLLAALSVVAVWAFLRNADEEAREGLVQVPVYRALEFIPRGADGTEVIDLFEDSTELDGTVPEGAITTREQLEATLIGRVSLGPISARQVVTTDLWAEPGADILGLAELLEPGFQAISIRPDEVRGVAGFVEPGDQVNVLASAEVDISVIVAALRTPAGRAVFFPGLQGQLGLTDEEMIALADSLPTTVRYTQFVLQELTVLAVGSDTTRLPATTDEEAPEEVAPVLTLAVTADQAEKLVFTYEYTSPWLTLIPPDYEPVETDGVVAEDLVGLPAQIVEQLRGLGFFAIPGN